MNEAGSSETEITQSRLFQQAEAEIVSLEEYLSVDFLKALRFSKFREGTNFYFVKPPRYLVNHVFWGGRNTHDDYRFGGKDLEGLLEDRFNEVADARKYLVDIAPLPSRIISVKHFSFAIFEKFHEWACYSEQIMVVSPAQGLIFARYEDVEYALYCRDEKLNPDPLPGVTDEEIVRAFHRDRAEYVSASDSFRMNHLKRFILPFCLEQRATE